MLVAAYVCRAPLADDDIDELGTGSSAVIREEHPWKWTKKEGEKRDNIAAVHLRGAERGARAISNELMMWLKLSHGGSGFVRF